MLGDIASLDLNPLLSAIKLSPNDKVVSIKEVGIADSNFIVVHLIKKIFQNNEKLCFINFHNSLTHYQIVGKKLGYDMSEKISCGQAVVVDMLKMIEEKIYEEDYGFLENKKEFLENIFECIEKRTNDLVQKDSKHTYIIIDDLSHLLDLGLSVEYMTRFISWSCNLTSNNISVVINNHVSSFEISGDLLPRDHILSNTLSYISDLEIEVSPLKTGRSNEVSGIINILRPGEKINKLHYKAFDRGIKTFKPGESLMYLLK
ncbi:hypothetical protein WA026_001911 [Henosepilachna vigintioctopunctata]|uniref:Elongator complex protein 6 n=1 Tax=Henosepilachna vigintioctopunctata TaxID=420089 RepID=A0AAW1URA4_9CUCU